MEVVIWVSSIEIFISGPEDRESGGRRTVEKWVR